MKIRLGYVAIPLTLAPLTSSSSMTYTYYESCNPSQREEKLEKIILSNFSNLKEILLYNYKNEIEFYRMTSNLIPFATHPKVTLDLKRYQEEWQKIGELIKRYHMRVDTHPDQFCVLNSVRSEVVLSSINMLKYHEFMFQSMQIDGQMILHIGSGTFGVEASKKRFIKRFKELDPYLQKHIILENDDKIFTMKDTLEVCETLKIPMVLDYHHHLCNNHGEKVEDYIEAIFQTWKDTNYVPKIHFSSPKSKKEFRSHHDYVNLDSFLAFLEKIKFTNQDCDIMLEAKAKDEAMFRLIRGIKYKTDYKFIKNTIFEL